MSLITFIKSLFEKDNQQICPMCHELKRKIEELKTIHKNETLMKDTKKLDKMWTDYKQHFNDTISKGHSCIYENPEQQKLTLDYLKLVDELVDR